MKIFEYKLYGTESQFQGIDQGIRTTQFIRNKCIRLWIDEASKPKATRKSIGRYDFNNYCVELSYGFDFCAKLNSMARQAAAERAWSAVANFYNNCKRKIKGKKVILNLKIMFAPLNIKQVDGNYLKISNN
jgi:putative transposase